MTIDDKERILQNIFNKTDFIDEKDKPSIIAYIRGIADTRERIRLENKEKSECTKSV